MGKVGAARVLRVAGRERGDTLAEVLVAIALVGIVSIGMFSAFTTSTLSANALTLQDRMRNELLNGTATIQNASFALAAAVPEDTAGPQRAYMLLSSKGVTFDVVVIAQPTERSQEIRITATLGGDTLSQTILKGSR